MLSKKGYFIHCKMKYKIIEAYIAYHNRAFEVETEIIDGS